MHRVRTFTRLLGVWAVAYVLIAQAALGAFAMVGQAHAAPSDPFGVHCLNGDASADQDTHGQLQRAACCTIACLSHVAAPPPELIVFAFAYVPQPSAPRPAFAAARPWRAIAERRPTRPRDPPAEV